MNITTILVIAIALAMDAFAVSIASGASYKRPEGNHALRLAVAFGLFQAVMPIIGWAGGLAMKDFIKGYDHWVAFILLVLIGAKMVYESFKINPAGEKKVVLTNAAVFVLAVATSIDALAVGVTFSFLLVGSLFGAVVIIGVVTFVFSYCGFYIGKTIGHLFENKVELAGGLILIGIGLKILLEHLFVVRGG